MSKLTEWLGWDNPVELKLQSPVGSSARVMMPMAEPLVYDNASLRRYARRSELVYACIEKKAQASCDAELIVEKKVGGDWEKVEGHPLVSLLNKPNPYDDGESFRRSWVSSENFADMFYAEIVRSGAGRPVELYPLDPTKIRPDYRATATGWELYRYIYTSDGYETYYLPEELLIRRRHAYGTLYGGISAVQIALGSIDTDTAQVDFVRAFFTSGGRPSGIITVKGRQLSETEAQAIQQKFTHKYSRSGTNQGGVAVFNADDAEYQTIGSGLDELDSDNLTQRTESRICMAFGVPPVLIGAYVGLKNVNQKASFQGAMEEFWINTMSPELKSIRVFLTWNLLPMFEDIEAIKRGDIRVNWDMSQVGAMQESLDDITKRTVEAYQGGIYTLNEARQALKLEPIEGEEGDALYKPTPVAMNPAPDDAEPVPPKQLTDGKGRDDDYGIKDYINDRLKAMIDERDENGNRILDADTLEKKSDYRRELTPVEQSIDIKAIETAYESGKESLTRTILGIRGELYKQGAREGAKLKDKDLHKLALAAPAGAYKRIEKEIRASINAGIDQISVDRKGILGSTPKAKLINHNGLDVSTAVETKGLIDDLLKRLVELTLSRVIGEVSTAVSNIIASLGVLGYDRDDIEDEIERRLDERSDAPYEAYARQATNSAVNAGRREEMAAREDDIEVYTYSAILDQNLCPECEQWEGATANTLDQLPDVPLAECLGMANCRCFIIATFKGEGAVV